MKSLKSPVKRFLLSIMVRRQKILLRRQSSLLDAAYWQLRQNEALLKLYAREMQLMQEKHAALWASIQSPSGAVNGQPATRKSTAAKGKA